MAVEDLVSFLQQAPSHFSADFLVCEKQATEQHRQNATRDNFDNMSGLLDYKIKPWSIVHGDHFCEKLFSWGKKDNGHSQ